jgi:hypothetical protein
MATSSSQALSAAVLKLLEPLVRVLLRNGVPYGVFADLAKRAYVDIAMNDFELPGRKQTVSRVSVITGLSRKEISHLQKMDYPEVAESAERYNRAARVVSGWVRDAAYKDSSGKPRLLPVEGGSPSFSELVKKFSGDVPARAILDELLRVGVVEKQADGTLRLLERAYVPRTGETDKLGILGTDVAGLISTIDHNLQCEPDHAYFQRKVFYDNLPEEAIPELLSLTTEQGQALLERLDDWMSSHDRDSNPDVTGTGRRRAGIGVYYFEDEESTEEQS